MVVLGRVAVFYERGTPVVHVTIQTFSKVGHWSRVTVSGGGWRVRPGR